MTFKGIRSIHLVFMEIPQGDRKVIEILQGDGKGTIMVSKWTVSVQNFNSSVKYVCHATLFYLFNVISSFISSLRYIKIFKNLYSKVQCPHLIH